MTTSRTSRPQQDNAAIVVVASEHNNDEDDSNHPEGTYAQLHDAFQNKNIGRVLGFSFMDGGGHSIWNRQVFQVLTYQVGGDRLVGWMSAFSGFSQMLAAVIAGFVGDRLGRELVLKAGCACGLVAVVTTMWGVRFLSVPVLIFGQVMWGCYGGVASTGTEAIFADSVSTGQRAYIYNLKWMVQSMSSVVGFTVCLVLLVYMGNEWQQPAMKKTMYVGLLYHVVAMLLLLTLKQKYAVGDEETLNEAVATDLAIMDYEASVAEKNSPEGVVSPLSGAAHKASHGYSEASSSDHKYARGEEEMEDARRADLGDDSLLPSEQEEEAHAGTARLQPGRDATVESGVKGKDECEEDNESLSDSSSVCRAEGRLAHPHSDNSNSSNNRRKRYRVSTRRTLTPSEYSVQPPQKPAPYRRGEEEEEEKKERKASVPSTTTAAAATEMDDPLHIITIDGTEEEFIGEVAMIRKLNAEADARWVALKEEIAALPPGSWMQSLSLRLRHLCAILLTWECVPYFVCLVDFLVAVGSGMTMRYLSLFFVEKPYNVTPALLIAGELVACPLQAIFSYFVQFMGSFHTGRLPATVFVRGTGTTLLLLMGITHNVPLWIVFPMYVVRNSLMNSTAGITRSVIMDAVKKENRAKWSAFESFSSFTWAGSAVIGGYIAEAHGHQFTFAITALFHYLSLMVLIPAMIGAAPVEHQLIHFNRLKRDRMKRK